MPITAPAPLAYDLPGAHVALIRHDLAATLRAYSRPLAAAFVATASSAADWTLLAAELDSLGSRRTATYSRPAMVAACERMALGRAAETIDGLADICGVSADEWAADVRREMSRAVSA